ncbi:MAG: hypothetical protein U5R48_14825 [Gammaproteobacteria bacterium]|nr:hypothetical protein [Gammaproteobacteria bacterium]
MPSDDRRNHRHRSRDRQRRADQRRHCDSVDLRGITTDGGDVDITSGGNIELESAAAEVDTSGGTGGAMRADDRSGWHSVRTDGNGAMLLADAGAVTVDGPLFMNGGAQIDTDGALGFDLQGVNGAGAMSITAETIAGDGDSNDALAIDASRSGADADVSVAGTLGVDTVDGKTKCSRWTSRRCGHPE